MQNMRLYLHFAASPDRCLPRLAGSGPGASCWFSNPHFGMASDGRTIRVSRSPRRRIRGCIVATAGDKLRLTVRPTPTITIHVPGPLRTYCAGAAQLSMSARTVRAALEDLQRSQSALYCNVCDETGKLRRHLNVFVNSDNVRDLDGVDTKLSPGDVVTILPAVSGG
jgi:molybdopterin converting factor small subunit